MASLENYIKLTSRSGIGHRGLKNKTKVMGNYYV
jgi:hypothetical protein